MRFLSSRFTTSQWAILLLSILAFAVIVWAYHNQVSGFEASHRNLSASSTTEVANQVSFILQERQRQVRLFAEDHLSLLRQLQSSPGNDQLHLQVDNAIKRALPSAFTFTISDASGVPYLLDFDGFVGDVCVADIKKFAANGSHNARIHPNNFQYHFDIMAGWKAANGNQNLLMVSFEPSELAGLLKAVESPGHQLMLVSADEPHLIEVTSQGGRDKTPRDDYRLTEAELSRMLSKQPAKLSNWQVADFILPGYFENFHKQVLTGMLVFVAAFMVVIGVSLKMIRREENRRKVAEGAREELVSMITHEMRTPVTAIAGTLSLMNHGLISASPDAMKNALTLMERNTDRLRNLIDDLLESRRIDSASFTLQKIPVNLAQIIPETAQHLRDYISKLETSIEIGSIDATLWVNADPVRLQQILSNLISNAAKFSPVGGVIHVAVAQLNVNMVRISVIDAGQGIPAAFQKEIFKKFSRGPAPLHRKVSSTGLGLCIVKQLVEAHGGKIDFQSAEGKGTTFFFDMPLTREPEKAKA